MQQCYKNINNATTNIIIVLLLFSVFRAYSHCAPHMKLTKWLVLQNICIFDGYPESLCFHSTVTLVA